MSTIVQVTEIAFGVNQPATTSEIEFQNESCRLKVVTYDPKAFPPSTPNLTGLWFSSLKIDEGDLQISSIQNSTRLYEFLKAFSGQSRRLVLINQMPTNANAGVDCMYKYRLPSHTPHGLTIDGFPPRIRDVAPTSPLFQKVYPNQFVHGLSFADDRPPVTSDSPGFTGSRVAKELDDTQHLESRFLEVKDLNQSGVKANVKTKFDKKHSEHALVDDGCCIILLTAVLLLPRNRMVFP